VRDRGLGEVHFDAVAQHPRATLVELGVSEALIAEALGIVSGVKDEVLCR
jgi:hypothetical protein